MLKKHDDKSYPYQYYLNKNKSQAPLNSFRNRELQKQTELDQKLKLIENQGEKEFKKKNYEEPTKSVISKYSKYENLENIKVKKLKIET